MTDKEKVVGLVELVGELEDSFQEINLVMSLEYKDKHQLTLINREIVRAQKEIAQSEAYADWDKPESNAFKDSLDEPLITWDDRIEELERKLEELKEMVK